MQNLALLTLAILIMSFSCKEAPSPNPQTKNIFGKWNWVKSSGGIAGATITPESEGYTKTIELSSEGVYTEFKNGQEVVKLNFNIQEGKSIFSSSEVELIKFKDNAKLPYSFEIKGDSLFLNMEVYDGFSEVYVKAKK